MTEDELRILTIEVGKVLDPYARSGKIAGFRMVLAVFVNDKSVSAMVLGSSINDRVYQILADPKFTEDVDDKPPVYLRDAH